MHVCTRLHVIMAVTGDITLHNNNNDCLCLLPTVYQDELQVYCLSTYIHENIKNNTHICPFFFIEVTNPEKCVVMP